jgi:hypothetical protein
LSFAFLFLFFSLSFWLGEIWILLKDAIAVLPPSAKIFARMPPAPQSARVCRLTVAKGIPRITAIAPSLLVIRAQTGATTGPAFITIMLTRPVIIKTRSVAADTSMIPRSCHVIGGNGGCDRLESLCYGGLPSAVRGQYSPFVDGLLSLS